MVINNKDGLSSVHGLARIDVGQFCMEKEGLHTLPR
jgi:hypothetical protein